MGQNSSKRRSSKGRSKNETKDISQRTNGDDPNGGIEVLQKTDNSPPTSPTSLPSASPSTASGKKEKKKRFRVGFSLKRTPSGRWSRKKKTSSLNGTRPVSCPDPLRPELAEKPDRPHSLFLDELDIPEEDTKVETVDLSDNEESKKKTADEDKSAPKAPERSKWKRGSHKKSSGKQKKKKEKQTPKKEKKKKEKSGEDVTDVVTTPDTTSPAQKTVNVTSSHENKIDVLDKDVAKDMPTSQKQMSEDDETDVEVKPGMTNPAQMTVDVTSNHEHTIEVPNKEDAEDVPKFEQQKEEIDIVSIAATIVAQALEVAQNRLRSEACNNKTITIPNDHTAHQVRPDTSSFECLNSTEIAGEPSNETPLEAGQDITTTNPEEIESTAKIAQEIAEIIDKSMDTIPEPSMDMELTRENKIEPDPDKTEAEDTSIPNTDDCAESQIGSEESKTTSTCPQVKTEHFSLANSAILHSNVQNASNNASQDVELNVENDESEAIAKKIVEGVIAASVEVVIRDNYVHENPGVDELHNKCTQHGSELCNDKINSGHGQEKGKTKLDTKKKNEDKTNKREKEKGRENVEENAGGKHDKEKPKSETKMTVTKKLSNWFHKKDKHSKLVSETMVETSATDATKQISHAASSEHTTESDLGQTAESITDHIPQDPTESKSTDPSSFLSASLPLGVNVTHLVMEASTLTESSTDYSDAQSAPSSISPASPISDSEEATSSPSGGDKSFGSSFLKKISIGPRLRTAILRKKSSGSSDDQDKTKPSLPLQKTDESTVLKPPPRKSRQRKSENQGSPDTSRTHNTVSSPDTSPEAGSSSTEHVLLSGSVKRILSTDDSGIADLTSLEGDKPASTRGDECKQDIEHETGDKAAIESVKGTNTLQESSTESSQDDHVDEHSTDDEDDTCPLSPRNGNEAMLYDVHSKSMNYYSPLQSPTLISTATIILRSVSRDEGVSLGDTFSPGDTSLNLETQPENTELSTDSMSKIGGIASTESTSHYLSNSDVISTENASESLSSLDNHYKHDHPDQKTHIKVLSSTQETVKTNVVTGCLENDRYEPKQDLDVTASPRDSKEKLCHRFSHLQARTIAEYSIGLIADPAGTTGAIRLQDNQTNFLVNQQTVNSVKVDSEGIRSSPGSTAPHSWLEEDAAADSSLIDPYFDAATQEHSSQAVIEKAFQKETKNSLNLQSKGAHEQEDFSSVALKVSQDGLNMSQITGCSKGVLDADNVNNNGHHEDESLCLKGTNSVALESCKDKFDVLYQKTVGSIDGSSKGSDEMERTEPSDANVVHQTFLNGDLSIEGGTSSKTSSVSVGEKDDI